jgi:hypothetical protein
MARIRYVGDLADASLLEAIKDIVSPFTHLRSVLGRFGEGIEVSASRSISPANRQAFAAKSV